MNAKESYASPVLWHNGQKEYLVVLGCDYCTAHQLSDGAEIWRVGDLNPKNKYNKAFRIIATPAAVGELIVVPSARDGPVIGVKPDATRHGQDRRPVRTMASAARTGAAIQDARRPGPAHSRWSGLHLPRNTGVKAAP